MENDKSKESRKSRNRKKSVKKDEKREVNNKMKYTKNEESVSYRTVDTEDKTIVPQETSLVLENSENGSEDCPTSSHMCPILHRQLQTHKNILQLLHEHKLASTQINGQRILSNQPFRWSGPTPGIECEIFVGRIPKTIYEDTLYPLFKLIGEIFQIRLMVDMAELTRGYCFIMYTNPEDAARAIAQLDQYEISPGRKIRVLASVNKCKLYIGPLPWHIASEEVIRVIYASAWDIEYVSIYRFLNHDAAYAIVSFKSHRSAALARRKLRPERLFKCNEVHVEWARVDWSPSNVYEDRGTVNDKGNVQIIRKYVQPKKTASSSISTSKDSGHCQKKMLPISPPNHVQTNSFKQVRNSTRYSTMLTMSAALDESSLFDRNDKRPEVVTDINDNVQPLNCNTFKNYMHGSKDTNVDNFPNFDMWNSNLVSQLPNSSTNISSQDYDTLNTMPSISSRENNMTSNVPFSNGYQHVNDTSDSDYNYPYYDSSNKIIDRDRPIAIDTVRYQTVAYQNHLSAPCYMQVQPRNFLHPENAITYLQPAVVNHICGDSDQKGVFLPDNYDHPPYSCKKQIDGKSIAINLNSAVIERYNDWKLQHAESSAKSRNSSAAPCQTNSTSNYIQNYAPNIMLNLTPVYALNPARNSAPNIASSYSIPTVTCNDERRARPILKRIIGRIQ